MLIHDRTEAEGIIGGIQNNRVSWKRDLANEDCPLWKVIKQMEEENEELNGIVNSYAQHQVDTAKVNLEDALKYLRDVVYDQIGDFDPVDEVPSENMLRVEALREWQDNSYSEHGFRWEV